MMMMMMLMMVMVMVMTTMTMDDLFLYFVQLGNILVMSLIPTYSRSHFLCTFPLLFPLSLFRYHFHFPSVQVGNFLVMSLIPIVVLTILNFLIYKGIHKYDDGDDD